MLWYVNCIVVFMNMFIVNIQGVITPFLDNPTKITTGRKYVLLNYWKIQEQKCG